MLKLIEGKQYETTAGKLYFMGFTDCDFTCDICHKKHYGNKRQEQTFYDFYDTTNAQFSLHYTIGTTCIHKFLKVARKC